MAIEEREVQTAPFVTVDASWESFDTVSIDVTSIGAGPALDLKIEVSALFSYDVIMDTPLAVQPNPFILRIADMRFNPITFQDDSKKLYHSTPVLPEGKTYKMAVLTPKLDLPSGIDDQPSINPYLVVNENNMNREAGEDVACTGAVTLQIRVSYRSAFDRMKARRAVAVYRVRLPDYEYQTEEQYNPEKMQVRLVSFQDLILNIDIANEKFDRKFGGLTHYASTHESFSIDDVPALNSRIENLHKAMTDEVGDLVGVPRFSESQNAMILSYIRTRTFDETNIVVEQERRRDLLTTLGFSEWLLSVLSPEATLTLANIVCQDVINF